MRPALALPVRPPATPFADGATLLVAGPESGATDRWAALLGPALGRGLPPGTQVHTEAVGGPDGVTGANQFEARTTPDGTTALLLPGSAALAWLVGDPRARFDAAHWMPAAFRWLPCFPECICVLALLGRRGPICRFCWPWT